MDVNERARGLLLAEVKDLSDGELNKMPQEDRWSIRQIIEHLYLMEGSISHIIQKQLQEGEDEDIGDKPIQATVDRSTKVDAPPFAKPSDDFISLDQLISNLEKSHNVLLNIKESAAEEALSKKAYLHPVFGKVSLKQWIPFVGYHELRHIEQIKEVKAEFNLS